MKERILSTFKISVIILTVSVLCVLSSACVSPAEDTKADAGSSASSSLHATAEGSSEIEETLSPENTEEVSQSATPYVTEKPLPTPNTSATKEEINTEIAESFFDGEWESSAGMIYIFDGEKGTVILKEKSTGEMLLEGTYETSSEDFSEYRLSMTFHGETDSFIAWRYSDSGSVRLIIEETGATYDLLWRVEG